VEIDLERTRDKVDTEMGRILASVEELTAHLAHLKAGPLPTATECLKMRERRCGIDRVADAVEASLTTELEVVSQCQATLAGKMEQANKELAALKNSQRLLDGDLHNKSSAENIDMDTLTLLDQSPGSFPTPSPSRSPYLPIDLGLLFSL
jgi:hypothetical protein